MEPSQEKVCPSCGARNNPEAVICNSCHKGFTLMGRMAQPWGKGAIGRRLSCTWSLMAGSGCLLLFVFPPVGFFILLVAAFAQFMMNKVDAGKCPHCARVTTVPRTVPAGSAVPCMHCRESIYVDRSAGKVTFSADPPEAPLAGNETSVPAGPPPKAAPKGPARPRPKISKPVGIALMFFIIIAANFFFDGGSKPGRKTRTAPPTSSAPPAATTGAQGGGQRKDAPGAVEPAGKVPGSETKAAGGAPEAGAPRQAPPPTGNDERILNFGSDVTINADASLTVRETIRVRAMGRNIKRGIFRDFPTRYRDRHGNRVTVGFKVLEVLRDGKSEPFHSKSISDGVRVYIGKSSVLLKPGVYTYALTYRTERQIGFFDEFDELYWNVTGNDWSFPIDEAKATIHLPDGARTLTHAAYTGPKGAQGKDFTVDDSSESETRFATTRVLRPGEGFTVAVSWPKGVLAEPDTRARLRWLLADNPTFLIAAGGLLLVLLYYAVSWFMVGRDPQAGVIVPHYTPPESYSPAAVRYVMRMGYSDRVFAAAVVNMAVKGYLTIEEDNTFVLQRVTRDGSALSEGEKKIARELFRNGERIELKKKNHRAIGAAVRALKEGLAKDFQQMNFKKNSKWLIAPALLTLVVLAGIVLTAADRPAATFLTFWLGMWTLGTMSLLIAFVKRWFAVFRGSGKVASAIGITFFALPFLGGEAVGLWQFSKATSPPVGLILLVLLASHVLFAHLLKAPTLQGRRVMDRIEGFRTFLAATEQDRLERMNPPEKTPALFEKFLPFALALGVENSWSEKFAGVLSGAGEGGEAYRPRWYSGRNMGSFQAAAMASSLGNSFASAISTSATAPGSSSGSGGGGSSGGGGGGGGGGGW